jgi:glycosyltransferase involved in cell wall biosynthesis
MILDDSYAGGMRLARPTLLDTGDKTMRILYSHRVQSRDGQSVHIEELVTAFRKAGHEVLVVGPGLYNRATFGGESGIVPWVKRSLPDWFVELAEILYSVLAYHRLYRAWRNFSPDFIYERYNLYHVAGALLRQRHKTRLYLEVNSPLAKERAHFGNLRFHRLAQRLEQYVWRSADNIFVVSEVLKQFVVAAGVPQDRVIVIPNGVDLDRFPIDTSAQQTETALTIGFIGFVRDWHGLNDVIAGLSEEPYKDTIQLLIAGDGPARLSLERQATELGVKSQVQFLGLQQREGIARLIQSFDIAIQPQSVTYASPLKLFEYMACARAIVAPDQPNIREILVHNETALLFDPGKPGALWHQIKRFAAHPELRSRLGCAARHTLEERDYTWQGNVFRIMKAAATSTVTDGAVATHELAHALDAPDETR